MNLLSIAIPMLGLGLRLASTVLILVMVL